MAQASNWVKPEEVRINSITPECALAVNIIYGELALLLTRENGDTLKVKIDVENTKKYPVC